MKIRPLRSPDDAPGGGSEEVPKENEVHTPEHKETPVEETPRTKDGASLVGADGRVYDFDSRDELVYLATKGLHAMQAESATPPKDQTPKEEPKDEEKTTDNEVIARLDRMEENQRREKREKQIAERRAQIENEINEGLGSIPYLEDKPRLRTRIEKLVKADLVESPGKKISTIIDENARDILGSHYENYVKDKKNTRDNTALPRGGGTKDTPTGDDRPKFSAKDFESGKLRRHVAEKLSAASRSRTGAPNFK
jgi:hypothetical protein